MALLGSFAAIRAQLPRTAGFSRALAYAEDLQREGSPAWRRLRDLAAGGSQKIVLGDAAFAIEQVYVTRPRSEGFFESHRKYIDVQLILEGEELMELVDAARIASKGNYDPERDLQLYGDVADASRLRVQAGEATVFFPVDVHMPTLIAGAGPVLVRKSVVKVPVA